MVVETFTKNNNAVNGQTPYLFRFPDYFEYRFSPSVAVNPESWNHSLYLNHTYVFVVIVNSCGGGIDKDISLLYVDMSTIDNAKGSVSDG